MIVRACHRNALSPTRANPANNTTAATSGRPPSAMA
jgi:hypothetical protein